MSRAEEYKQLNTHKASVLTVGGFRPTGNPLASHFGLAPVALPGEGWPSHEGKPLFFVCQLNLTEAPFIPGLLQDVKLITFFIDPKLGLLSEDNGKDWHLRAYKTLDGLTPLKVPEGATVPRGFEAKWNVGDDQPVYDDPDLIVPQGFDNTDVHLENVRRTKIGGYASNIQSEPWWGSGRSHPAQPRYCLQIASEEKVNLQWGDQGTIYIARGTAPGFEDKWYLDWQCY
jgi:uncharacterized protein YwqG